MTVQPIESKRPKLYIFDKDGCLVRGVVEKNGRSHAPNTLESQSFFEDVARICEALRAAGHTLTVASNQGGVAFGIMTPDMAELLVKDAADYIGAKAYRVCFYHPNGKVAPYNADSYNRKPNPGMLESLMAEFGFLPQDTIVVGDWDTDQQAAQNAGCTFVWAHELFQRVDPFADRLRSVLGANS